MEDGAWMLWENSSVAVVVVAVAHLDFEKLLEFYYEIGASGVRGSIRLVERLPKVICTSNKSVKKQKYQKRVDKNIKNR